MNWIFLISASVFVILMTYSSGKTKDAVSGRLHLWWAAVCHLHVSACSFWRLFFLSTLVMSIVGLKIV